LARDGGANPNFGYDFDYEVWTGMLNGLLMRERADLQIANVHPEADERGAYKPILVVELTNGRTFRLIVTETP